MGTISTTDPFVGGIEIGGDHYNGGWRWRTLGICASCVAVLALADVSVRIGAGVTAALIPPTLVFASTLLRGRPLAVIATLSLADLLLLYGIEPRSRIEIVIVGVIAVAAAGVGVWLRRHSVATARAAPPEDVGPRPNGQVMLTGRLQQSPYAEQPDATLTLRLAGLSRREQDVARLVLDGLPTREIADRLFISERTVETHLANIFDKFDVHSRSELADSLLNRKPLKRKPLNGKPQAAGDAHPSRRSRRR
jgi:DNA-binding CsgD family transcriptional regulator